MYHSKRFTNYYYIDYNKFYYLNDDIEGIDLSWDNISDKPTTFTPSTHTHDWSSITSKPSTYTPASHDHDSSYLKLSGGSLSGGVNFSGSAWNLVGDDVAFGDQNIGGHLCVQGRSISNGGGFAVYDIHGNLVGKLSAFSNAGVVLESSYGDTTVNVCGNSLQSRNKANNGWAPVNASAFNIQSSRRYKENIIDITDEVAKQVLDYRVVSYDYKNKEDGIGCIGLIAEEVNEINTYPVTYDKEGQPDSLDYSKFVPQLIKIIQLQQKEIDELKDKVDLLSK